MQAAPFDDVFDVIVVLLPLAALLTLAALFLRRKNNSPSRKIEPGRVTFTQPLRRFRRLSPPLLRRNRRRFPKSSKEPTL